MTTKNKCFDKNEIIEYGFKDLIGESFLFSAAGEMWKKKRKACAHAFYKDRLDAMMETLKTILADQIDLWNVKIGIAKDKKVVIDMAETMEKIFAKNIIFITFGE
jgi:cytochrome P450